jgi:glycosyltransferase involved in cell wall biosynthesis
MNLISQMRILWITNTIFPEPSKALGLSVPIVGGWMYGLAEELSKNEDFEFGVATVYKKNDIKVLDINGIKYYLLPCKNNLKYQKNLELLWEDVINSFMPDLVHIHGTEYTHGLACINSKKNIKYIVSVQGLVSVIERYYYAGLSNVDIIKNIAIKDILKMNTVFQEKNKYKQRGHFEKEIISKVSHVVGRTEWDKQHINAINNSVVYHHCNETLRNKFYTSEKWDIKSKKEYSIFISQGAYPIKGLHNVLKAVGMIKKEFPSISIKVAGNSIIRNKTIKEKLSLNGYGLYIKRLIKKLYLDDVIVFTGSLSEDEMIKEYLSAHLFICPSSIENSPNSLGEAQILGVPVIAAYVGGIPDMVKHNETGMLYRFEEIEMLAGYIRKIFSEDSLATKLSLQGIKTAEHRHDRVINGREIMKIYSDIVL